LLVVADHDDDDDDDGLFIGQIYTTHVTIRTYDSLLQLLGSCWIWSKSSCSQHVYSQCPAGRKPFPSLQWWFTVHLGHQQWQQMECTHTLIPSMPNFNNISGNKNELRNYYLAFFTTIAKFILCLWYLSTYN